MSTTAWPMSLDASSRMTDNSVTEAELMMQSEKLYISYHLNGNLDDLQRAVSCAEKVLDLMPPDSPSMPYLLYNLARSLLRRFLHTRQVQDVEKAIETFRHACRLFADDDPVKLKCFHSLVACYFVRDGNLDILLGLKVPDVYRQSKPSITIETNLMSNVGEEEELFHHLHGTISMLESSLHSPPGLKEVDFVIQLSRQALKLLSPSQSNPVYIAILLFHLGTMLATRYALESDRLEVNNEAIHCFCRALSLGLPASDLACCLTFASIALRKRFDALGKQEDLDNAEDLTKQAVKMLEAYDRAKRIAKIYQPRDAVFQWCLDNLARLMSHRYRNAEEVDDIKLTMEALTIDCAVDNTEDKDSKGILQTYLNDLGTNHRLGVQSTASKSGEEEELKVQSKKLYVSYVLTGNLDDLQAAVHCAEEIIALLLPRGPLMPDILYNLARLLFRRFLHTKQKQDITMAIELSGHAFQLLADQDPMRPNYYRFLIVSYFVQDGNLVKFPERNAPNGYTQLKPSHVLETTLVFNSDENELFDYLQSTTLKSPLPPQASLENVDSAIQLSRQALNFFSRPASDPAKISMLLYHLGELLRTKYSMTRNFHDNSESADCFCRALELRLPTQPLGKCLRSASGALADRFRALGKQEDLDNAIDLAKQAMKIFEAFDHARQAVEISEWRYAFFAACMGNLANGLSTRYRATGEMNDLNAAIGVLNRAVGIAEDNESKTVLAGVLGGLAGHLRLRSQRTGQSENMKVAIEMLQRAVDLRQPKDPRRIPDLISLSTYETDRERSAKHLQEAWSIGGEDIGSNPEIDLYLINGLASRAFGNSTFSGKAWSEESIALAKVGTSITHALHPLARYSRAIVCANLYQRWRRTDDIKDINEAIDTAREMIDLAKPLGTGEAISSRRLLGGYLYDRYKSTGDDGDHRTAVDILLEGFYMSGGSPTERILAGEKVIEILSEKADWKRAHKLSGEIVDLLVILNGRSLDWTDKQFRLGQFSTEAASHASIALEAGSNVLDVIDMLETCRGSILGHVIDSRTDLDDLMEAAPEKAKLFRTLQIEINSRADSSETVNSRVEQITRREEVEADIRACLEDIRRLEGFRRFLLGPTENEMKNAAARGPIVIVIVSSIRSDAIIITENAFTLLPLPELKYEEAAKHLEIDLTDFSNLVELGKKNKKFRKLQIWLWDKCVKSIFDELKGGPEKFHIWWIGIGLASCLPFHAAGIYNGNVNETALCRAISSYTPTLKVLIHGRGKVKNDCVTCRPETLEIKPRLAIIIMPSTPGKEPLEGVAREAEEIQHIVQDTYSTQIILQPSAKDTKARMAECEIVHFACHGESILEDPSSSHLLLQVTNPDSAMPVIDKLKLRDVAAADLGHGKLAFLSACSTAQNRLTKLRDEALHLASGFQVAGYQHAIGNLWLADDEASVQLVKRFYQHLVAADDGHNVASALNEAVIDVAKQREYINQPLSWAQFVHFGI